MTPEEFLLIANSLKGPRTGWLERLHQLTLIDKSALHRYGTGERTITQSHALFIRNLYFLHHGFPDLAGDITVMTRKPVTAHETYPVYEDIKDRATLLNEIRDLKGKIAKIHQISS